MEGLNVSQHSARSSTSIIQDGTAGTKMPHQWERSTRTLVDSARSAQRLSTNQRQLAFGVQKGTDAVMVQDNQTSTRALSGMIKACEDLKSRVEQQLESVVREAVLLEEEAARAEVVNAKLREPLSVAEECLSIRRRRPARELTRDSVERALNEQVAASKHSLRMVNGVLDAASKELARLRQCRERLEEDVEQKNVALDVDREALQMENGWSEAGTQRHPASIALPHMWRQRTEHLIEESERVRATCERLRAKSRAIQEEIDTLERETRENTTRALGRKIEEAERLKGECQAAIATVEGEIATMDSARGSVEQSLSDKLGPLSLARSRLSVRNSKPGAEAIRDSAERSLEKEVADLEQSIRKLQLETARQTSDIKRLEASKAQLDSDMLDK
eukprot:CAMPEP_0174939876 /NCGR_PEP_ID=MMETSP1355-20121228/67726_1 /TAXON_ID=464990 /ORGANISM="Hemiselmis tepida, Strain CCMP443" /LENGTH=390 /DNA_ID=CAMNT_0016186917 /DNA_START=69 /DNA_END=1238 /DNA_ORIENTATION=-